MSKLVSAGLIAAAVFATPAKAEWIDKNGQVVHESRVVHCLRAPDVGQYAGGAYNQPPCEPATLGAGLNRGWRDSNGAVIDPSRVVHCIRAPDEGQYAGGSYKQPPCEPATWREPR
jgi:hypothetical protein